MPLKLYHLWTRQDIKSNIVSMGHGEIRATLKDIKEAGLVVPIISLFNSPMQAPKKVDGFWRLAADHSKQAKVSLLEQINTTSSIWYVAIYLATSDIWNVAIYLANTFFWNPIRKEDQKQFLFTWERQEYTFIVLFQGNVNPVAF